MRRSGIAAIVAANVLGGLAVQAQGLSDDEMLMRFKAQKDVFKSATAEGATAGVKTRGLTLVTVGEQPAQTGATVEAGGVPVSDPNTPLVARFDPELSVDVRIEFDFDSAAISASQQPALEQVCRVMKLATDIGMFRVVGHTDASGSDAYNLHLSTLRAEEVGRYLVETCGIAASRLEMVGYGEQFLSRPDAPDDAANRRVEFQALS